MSKTRIYFVSDLHGSSVCFRKFINAARVYEANVLILGGDVAGKAIQSIVRAPGGRWQCRFVGTDYDVTEGPELIALEKLIADHGYYPYRADPGELEAKEANGGLDSLFLELMRARLTEWLDLADARLRPQGIPLHLMLGNDDPAGARRPARLRSMGRARRGEGGLARRRARDDQPRVLERHALAHVP